MGVDDWESFGPSGLGQENPTPLFLLTCRQSFETHSNVGNNNDNKLTNIQKTMETIPIGKRVSKEVNTRAVRTPSLKSNFFRAS